METKSKLRECAEKRRAFLASIADMALRHAEYVAAVELALDLAKASIDFGFDQLTKDARRHADAPWSMIPNDLVIEELFTCYLKS